MTHPPRLELTQPDRSHGQPEEPEHREVQGLEHAPDDPVPTLMDLELHERAARGGVHDLQVVGPGRAVLELYALAQGSAVGPPQLPVELDQVALRDAVRRMGE